MSFRLRPQSRWIIARRKERSPLMVTSLRFRTKKQAMKEASELNRKYEGSGIEFLVRKAGWNRKRWWS